jgi:trehalose 6-phosphate phosphatase
MSAASRIAHASALPDWIRQECIKLAERSANILLEDKGYSIALHYRLAPELERPICDTVAAMLATIPAGGLEALQDERFPVLEPATSASPQRPTGGWSHAAGQ